MTYAGAFKTTGTATYQVDEITEDVAEYLGCPGATHRLIGRHWNTLGYFVATGQVPGNEVRVPGWSERRGIRALFVPAVIVPGDTEVVDGYLGLN